MDFHEHLPFWAGLYRYGDLVCEYCPQDYVDSQCETDSDWVGLVVRDETAHRLITLCPSLKERIDDRVSEDVGAGDGVVG